MAHRQVQSAYCGIRHMNMRLARSKITSKNAESVKLCATLFLCLHFSLWAGNFVDGVLRDN
ncbi:hypothetical protein HBI56_032460 [Parastagonospora nodorum]|uniref:Uncharacterized protein n=1 Tax=Phaeosphaeria nodorum (strain SN15 / ATCC MYA-4574 / FGSC 10173) TaxID=321614 RepID=A0A7U2EYG4_PHANO|nr:hypothetical protein HBH56_020190 [Parastagonospora nodorum]QRC95411.1 hypothetical protein JI435_407310 [Parastagonospora nodorum SN15]KAH3937178.1 hypothetical protein HBH54_014320 [Parastagonospora nodorum]KAH3944078.1 hypothetical protein HBH53_162500 [Parastagonospora nodorum]KAH3967696.1 hypothetical protein HBH51_137990 [Parastagonospora nodorum]